MQFIRAMKARRCLPGRLGLGTPSGNALSKSHEIRLSGYQHVDVNLVHGKEVAWPCWQRSLPNSWAKPQLLALLVLDYLSKGLNISRFLLSCKGSTVLPFFLTAKQEGKALKSAQQRKTQDIHESGR